ncbi:DNA repair protein RecN [Herbiconiux sp. KACC 21604]|uniref:DNA repair protein RecN n=1 Tax=unclassified Herbiconiux TaxID=2618217 RepID=UPI00149212C0|nr:DNA repair protein RecN [Herbiconiux sp. SALV-R1]QJU53070.1 DNA repair protein RecN [Herbiconiux sp. SALV-R1]WPO88006.1 DNA repair protein RecN [Herbiconiux sp. KACC 21604]
MIEELSIRDLGVIGEAVLPLGPGFTAVTGETGAGKTMVVSALGLLFGERSDSGAVRSGAAQAWIEGRILVPRDGVVAERVREAGGDVDDQVAEGPAEVILSRSVSAEGRGRAVVGGRSAPISVLSELGDALVVVHGQSDQLRLKSQSAQRSALDSYGGRELAELLAEYRTLFSSWQGHTAEIEALVSERSARLREAEQLRAAIDEIAAVAPVAGEDAELADLAGRLTNLEDLRLAAAEAKESISSESGEGPDTVGLIDSARRSLERVAHHDQALAPIVSALAEASFLVSDLSTQLASYAATLETDEVGELDRVQERRADLGALTRKYGPELDDVIAFAADAEPRLLELDSDSDRIDQLTALVDDEVTELGRLAERLTALRRTAGEALAEQVTRELAALAMPNARFVVEVLPREELASSGGDVVQFLLRPHEGSEPRPLNKGASGGELSRVMLAIEVVLAAADPVPTFVFDEVDSGVGGASAIEIGRRLAALARTSQVIVVTHLAQVAAFATNHLRIEKDLDAPVTASNIVPLDGDERLAEMARLLSGLPDSESGLAHAAELLETAQALAVPH